LKRIIVRYIDGSQDEAWLQPFDDMLKNRELTRPVYRDPDSGESWVTDAERMACQVFFALQRAGRAPEGEFMTWYQRVDELEPHMKHREVDELLATGEVDAKTAAYLHKRVEELGDGEGESPAPRSH
jgi:hypothetical protein